MPYKGCIVTVLVVMLEFGSRQMHIGGAKGKRKGGGGWVVNESCAFKSCIFHFKQKALLRF